MVRQQTTGMTSTSSSTSTTSTLPTAPTAEPGQAGATVDGKAASVSMSRSNDTLVLKAQGTESILGALENNGQKKPLDTLGNIRVIPGDFISLTSSGFANNETIEIWLFSTPTKLGSIEIDAFGRTVGQVQLPPSMENGNHRLVLMGNNAIGEKLVVSVGIVAGKESEPISASKMLLIVPVSLALIAGFVIPTTVRRRRRAATA
jgi:hypothetical protein